MRQQTQPIQLHLKHNSYTIFVNRLNTLQTIESFIMKTAFFTIASMAIFGAMANPAPSPMAMGIEVVRRDGLTMVREVVSFSDHRLISVVMANLIPASLVDPAVHQLRSRRWCVHNWRG